jgi:hypothetical protein
MSTPGNAPDASIQSVAEFDYLVPGRAREAVMADHPLRLDEQILQTNAILMAYNELQKAIKLRRYGLAFCCPPRMGKTWAIDALVAMLQLDYPLMPVFSIEAFQHDDPTEKSLWTDILTSLGHLSGKTAQAQKAVLFDFIVSSAQLHNQKFVVFLVDEAQNWGSRYWRFIKGLVNALRGKRYRIRVLVVSFGQSDLLRVREAIAKLSDGGEDLLARFLKTVHEFPAIKNVQELRAVLAQLDDPQLTEYPEDSGVCYTRFFMPLSYVAGWRLEKQYEDVWKAFGALRRLKRQVTMLHLMSLLREFFDAAEDAADFTSTLPMWKRALAESYEESDA